MDGLTVLIILVGTILLVAVFNTICIYAIMKGKTILQQRPSTILILGLLTMHLLQAFFAMPFYAAKRNMKSSAVCTGFRFFYILTFYLAVFNVLMISIDRFLALHLKTSYSIVVTSKRALIALFCVWVYVIAVCSIPFKKHTKKCAYNPQKQWVFFMLLVNCALPYVITVVLYMYILYAVRQYSAANNKKKSSQPNARITRNTMILISTYGLAWTPSIIYFTLMTLSPDVFPSTYKDSPAEEYIGFFLKYIKFVEGITSPVLYCYLSKNYKRLLQKCWFSYTKNNHAKIQRTITSRVTSSTAVSSSTF